MRVLFFVEGFTDIRFVVGLSEICDLTMAVPAREYEASGLKQRVAESGARLRVHEIPGGRLAFQARSLPYLWRAPSAIWPQACAETAPCRLSVCAETPSSSSFRRSL